MDSTPYPDRFGSLLRSWREARGLSQLDLAMDCEISNRHLSCLESGKANPTPTTILRLAETLRIPLIERNNLLIAAGFSPKYSDAPFDSPEMAPTRKAMERLLRVVEPQAAMLVDRYYNTLLRNKTLERFQEFTAKRAKLRTFPDNGLELVLSPHGMKPFIQNWEDFARFLLGRCRQLFLGLRDPNVKNLLEHLLSLPDVRPIWDTLQPGDIFPSFFSFRMKIAGIRLDLQMVVTTFGTHQETNLAEYRIVTFVPESEFVWRFAEWLKKQKGPIPL